MHGPPLTTEEAIAVVGRKVTSLMAMGLPRPAAIRAAAAEFGVDPHRLAVVLGEPGDVSL